MQANVSDLKTVGEMQNYLSNQPHAGLATTIAEAVKHLRTQRDLLAETELSLEVLGSIRQAVYDTNDPGREEASVDPIMMLFSAMTSESGNATEDALQFIEQLQRRPTEAS